MYGGERKNGDWADPGIRKGLMGAFTLFKANVRAEKCQELNIFSIFEPSWNRAIRPSDFPGEAGKQVLRCTAAGFPYRAATGFVEKRLRRVAGSDNKYPIEEGLSVVGEKQAKAA